MLKKFLLFAIFIAFCFMIPGLFVNFSEVNNDKIYIENEKLLSGDISPIESRDKIKLLLSETNQIIELSMNDYIKGVVLRRNAYNF